MIPKLPTKPYCKDCDEGSSGSSSNVPPAQCINTNQAGVGTTNSVKINVKADDDFSLYHAHLGLTRLKLKSGGELPVSWNFLSGQGSNYGAVYDENPETYPKWQPVGRSGILSLIPYLNNEDTDPSIGQYIVKTHKGTIYYERIEFSTHYKTANNLPTDANYNPANGVFTENNYETGDSFEFGGEGHDLVGRPLKWTDRNGNVLNYNYVKPNDTYFLYSITGDISDVVPYFQYANHSIPAPITSILFKDMVGTNDRLVYFNYQGLLTPDATYLESIDLPDGSRVRYLLEYSGFSDVTALVREVDAEGHTTYFGYEGTSDKKILVKTTEPEDCITYYDYSNLNTGIIKPGRASRNYDYTFWGTKNVPIIAQSVNAVGDTAKYDYDLDLGRMSVKQNERGFVTYYKYTDLGSLASSLRVYDGAATYYGYASNLQDVLKTIGPRNSPTLPVVTYYQYDANRNRILEIDALGNKDYQIRDGMGRVEWHQNAMLATTYFNYSSSSGHLDSKVEPLTVVAYYGYDSYGNKLRDVSPRYVEAGSFGAFTTYYEYDKCDRQSLMKDPLGGTTYFGYTLRGDMAKQVDAVGTTTYFSYNGLRLMNAKVVAGASGTPLQTEYYGYDIYKNKVAVLDPGGHGTYFGYDAADRQIAQLDALQNSSYFGYDASGNQTAVVGPRWPEAGFHAFTTYYVYDGAGRSAAVLDALHACTYYGYDLADNQTQVQNARGFTTYFEFDALNRRIGATDPLGVLERTFYDAVGNVVCQTSADLGYGVQAYGAPPFGGNKGQTTYFQYDALNRRTVQIDALGSPTYFGYNTVGSLVRLQNPRGYVTYYQYDTLDRRTVQIDALHHASYFGYDAVGSQVRSQDTLGFVSYFQYDGLRRRTVAVDPLGILQRTIYDADGNVVCQTIAEEGYGVQAYGEPLYGGSPGLNSYFAYDALNRMTASVDGVFNTTYFAYDGGGNRVRTVSPRGYPSYFGYDALNRLAKTLNAVGDISYFGYDAVGNTLRSENALTHTTYFDYDPLNRLASQTDALGFAVYFAYDAAGNRNIEADQRGGTSYYFYDWLNRVASLMDPLGIVAYYGYDANSNLARTQDNKGTVVYFAYDALDRRMQVKYPVETQYFQYDAVSNLTAMRDAWGASYFAYDPLSRVTSRTTPRGDEVQYVYDAASNQRMLVYPQDGLVCYYEYDTAQRLIELTTPYNHAVYYAYDASSNVVDRTYHNAINNILSHAKFDAAERMNSLRYSCAGTPIVYFDYARDHGGRIVSIARESNLAIYYSYDDIDRLTSEVWRKQSDSSQIYAFRYSYDPTGNRLTMRREGTGGTEFESAYFAYAADNSLTKRRTFQPPSTLVSTYYYYDANGALIKEWDAGGTAATYFKYGPNQLVTKIAPPTGNAWLFSYDGRLNRYKIDKGGGVVTYLLWDGLNCLEERDGSGSLVVRYTYGRTPIYGIGSCVEIYLASTAKTYTLAMDHRGTVYKLIDDTGAVVATRQYDAFGVMLYESGTWVGDLGYQTNWQTVKIGGKLYCISKFRIYVPELGIFISRDFLREYLNKYRAFSNNPVGQVDRDGLADGDSKDGDKNKVPVQGPDLSSANNAFTGGTTSATLKGATGLIASYKSGGGTVPMPKPGGEQDVSPADAYNSAVKNNPVNAIRFAIGNFATFHIDVQLNAGENVKCYYFNQKILQKSIPARPDDNAALQDDGNYRYDFQEWNETTLKGTLDDAPGTTSNIKSPLVSGDPNKPAWEEKNGRIVVRGLPEDLIKKYIDKYAGAAHSDKITMTFETSLRKKLPNAKEDPSDKILGTYKWQIEIFFVKKDNVTIKLIIDPKYLKWE